MAHMLMVVTDLPARFRGGPPGDGAPRHGRLAEVEPTSADAAATPAADAGSAEPDRTTGAVPDADPAEDDAGQAGADVAAPRPGQRRSPRAATSIGAVVLALVLAVAGYEGWVLFSHHQQAVAAAQALAAAENYTIALTSIDPNAIDKNFAEVLDGATGDFKHLYAESSEQLRRLLIENKAAAHGTVIEAAVKSATKNRVEVMLFVDQSVSNKAAPGPQLDRSRIVLTMEKVDGRWLASKVDMP